jgi:O-antigen/teichoic acid export membrane protein
MTSNIAFVGSRLGGALAQAVMLLVLARGVSPSEFGQLSSITGVTILVVVVSDFGMSGYLLREVSALRHSSVQKLTVLIVSTAPLTCLAAVVAGLALDSTVAFASIVAIALWGFSERYAELELAHLLGSGRTATASALSLMRRVVPACCFFALLQVCAPALAYSLALCIGGSLAASAFAPAFLPHFRPGGIGPARALSAAWTSRSFLVPAIAAQSRELETPLVQLLAGATQAGHYGVGFRMARPISLVGTSIAQANVPVIAKNGRKAYVRTRKIVAVSMGIAALCLVGLSWFVADLLAWGLGDDYRAAGGPALLLVAAMLFGAASEILSAGLQALDDERFVSRVAAAFLGANLVSAGLGAMLFGADGAAVAVAAVGAVRYGVVASR